MKKTKTMYVVTHWKYGAGDPIALFLNEDTARQHAEEMEKIEDGSFHHIEVEVKDWPRDI